MNTCIEDIKNFAVKAVEAFINDKIPLNTIITTIATENELNDDQIKRIIEASNQIAYLKLLSSSKDRTFEFPVASFEEVSKSMLTPLNIEKEASFKNRSPLDIMSNKTSQEMEKIANDMSALCSTTTQEKQAQVWRLHKSAIIELKTLENKASECINKLASTGESFKKDSLYLNKLAQVASEEEYKMLSVFLGNTEFEKFASTGNIFKDSDLKEARDMIYLLKEAREIRDDISKHKKTLEKSANIIGKMVGGAFKGIGTAAGAAVGGAAVGGTALGIASAVKAGKGVNKVLSSKYSPVKPLDLLAPMGYKSERSVWDSLH